MITERTTVAAVILAAGSGSRMGGSRKQFLPIKGRPLLSYSVKTFWVSGVFSRVIIVVPKGCVSFCRALLRKFCPEVPVEIITGGGSRRSSIYRALQRLERSGTDRPMHVLIHDAARPLVSVETVRSVLSAAQRHGASVASIPAIDTLLRVRNGVVEQVQNKEGMYYSYTPQGFLFDGLLAAHRKANDMKLVAETADDLEILKATRSSLHVRVVESYPNFKLTYPSDLKIIEALME